MWYDLIDLGARIKVLLYFSAHFLNAPRTFSNYIFLPLMDFIQYFALLPRGPLLLSYFLPFSLFLFLFSYFLLLLSNLI